MKDVLVVVVTSVLFLVCTVPTVAQGIELIPELKPYGPILGKWTSEMESRESPDGDWQKGSESYEVRSGGFFVEFRGTDEIGGEKTPWIEVVGYDPVMRTLVSSFYRSDGTMGRVSSEWNGTALTVQFIRLTPEREVQIRHVTWEYSSDFKSVTGTVEQFNDGKWWAVEKYKESKVE